MSVGLVFSFFPQPKCRGRSDCRVSANFHAIFSFPLKRSGKTSLVSTGAVLVGSLTTMGIILRSLEGSQARGKDRKALAFPPADADH